MVTTVVNQRKIIFIGYWRRQMPVLFLFLTTFIGVIVWNRPGKTSKNIRLYGVLLICFLSGSFFSDRNSKKSSISGSGSNQKVLLPWLLSKSENNKQVSFDYRSNKFQLKIFFILNP